MALGQTCQANMIDELSLILLIENEMTRDHGVKTKEDAIAFWNFVRSDYSLLTEWLDRDYCSVAADADADASEPITVTREMLAEAVRYEVMFVKMLRTLPRSEQVHIVCEPNNLGVTTLHAAAFSGNIQTVKTILSFYPECQHLHLVSKRDDYGRTVLHHTADSGSVKMIQFLLGLWPDSRR